jgi:hypothetical protein
MANSPDFPSRLEDINKTLMKIADRTTPLLARHLDLSNPVSNYKHEWVDKTLVGFTDTLATSVASTTATIITLSGGTNAPKRIIDGVTVLLAGTERLLVTSTVTVITNSRTVVVTRGYHSSTAATFAAGKQIKLLNPRVEGFSAGRDDTQKGVRKYNYTVIVDREAKVSESSQGIDSVGMETMLQKQVDELVPEILKELENHFLYGERYVGASDTDRSAGGLIWWANNVGNSTTASTLNGSLIENAIQNYLSKGGDANSLTLICSVNQQRVLNTLKVARVTGGGQSQSENNINNYVDAYNFGSKANVNVFFSTDMRDDEVIFYDKSKVSVKPLRNNAVKQKDLPEDGHFKRRLVFGEYTFEVANAQETLYHYYGLATAS